MPATCSPFRAVQWLAIVVCAVASLALLGGCRGRGVTGPSVPLAGAIGTGGSAAHELPAPAPVAIAPVYSVTADWPAAGSTITGAIPASSWRTVREPSRILSRLRISGLAPGHVYNVHFVFFNYPEFCTFGSTQYSPPAACGAFGPTDPRDGGIPETGFSVVNYPGVRVGPSGAVVFEHKLGEDPPSEVITGAGLTNPLGAQVFANVVDKGPELPAGPLRDLQYNTLRGGCTGPPFFGPYPCTFAGNGLLR